MTSSTKKQIMAKFKDLGMGPTDFNEYIVICKKGKRRKFGKKGKRMLWTKGKTYKCLQMTMSFVDISIINSYWITTNLKKVAGLEPIDSVEFKQRFKIFTKV
jgi:hypothetical protein